MLNESNLHDYQKTCVKHIIERPYCGLFLEMGLGKTVSTLTAINYLMYRELEVDNVLVIAPKRVVESVWQEEAAKWSHLCHLRFSKIIGSQDRRIAAMRKKADIYLVSRDNIAWLCGQFPDGRLPYDMIVIDELSSFKSNKAVRFKAMKSARPFIKRLVGLTGTPAPNGLIDLWPQIYLMDRGERLGRTITTYRYRYFRPDRTNGHIVYSYRLLPGADELIRDKISDICISMKSDDYLQLPERLERSVNIDMPKPLLAQYKKFEKEKVIELYGNGDEITAVNAASLSNKLLQFSNGAIYDENGEAHEIHKLKLEALKEIVDDAQGQPVLVAWTYRFDRDRIMRYMAEYKPGELKTAADIRDWNNGKVQLLLAHPASAGHGLNLQAGGHIVVWFGLTWSLELYQQFNARLYRQGQSQPVVIHHLVVNGTHDFDVVRALTDKNNTQKKLMDSIKAKISKYLV